MAKVAARNARVAFGNRDLSADLNNVTLNLSSDSPEVTTFCDSYRVRLANSIRDAELSVDGFYNTAVSTLDYALMASSTLMAQASAAAFFSGYGGSKFGREFSAIPTKYDLKGATADAETLSATLTGNGTQFLMNSLSGSAVSLCGIPTVTGTGTSTMGSVLFGAASTCASTYINLRIFKLEGGGALTVSVGYAGADSGFGEVWNSGALAAADINEASVWSGSTDEADNQYRQAVVTLSGTAPCAMFLITCGCAFQ